MSEDDQERWDQRYAGRGPASVDSVGLPRAFVSFEDLFPSGGRGLDLACGQGVASVWLARRGMDVWGIDISVIAVGQARDLAQRSDVGARCRFDVADLDDGLPAGPPADVILCHRFWDPRLDQPITGRLAPGGLLAVTALSEVGAGRGRFRAAPAKLTAAFAGLHIIGAGEGDGEAWLLARK